MFSVSINDIIIHAHIHDHRQLKRLMSANQIIKIILQHQCFAISYNIILSHYVLVDEVTSIDDHGVQGSVDL